MENEKQARLDRLRNADGEFLAALRDIAEHQDWLPEHASMADYLRAEMGYSQSYAYRLQKATLTDSPESLPTGSQSDKPVTERQARKRRSQSAKPKTGRARTGTRGGTSGLRYTRTDDTTMNRVSVMMRHDPWYIARAIHNIDRDYAETLRQNLLQALVGQEDTESRPESKPQRQPKDNPKLWAGSEAAKRQVTAAFGYDQAGRYKGTQGAAYPSPKEVVDAIPAMNWDRIDPNLDKWVAWVNEFAEEWRKAGKREQFRKETEAKASASSNETDAKVIPIRKRSLKGKTA